MLRSAEKAHFIFPFPKHYGMTCNSYPCIINNNITVEIPKKTGKGSVKLIECSSFTIHVQKLNY